MRTSIALAAAAALAAPAVCAQMSGSASVTGLSTNANGENPFRYQEYRDLRTGLAAGVDVRGATEFYYWSLFGERLGRDDQIVELRGARYGQVKWNLYLDDVVHNLTFGARTLFDGVGTDQLTFAGPVRTDVGTWNRFDYAIKHRNVGGAVELQRSDASPYYLRTEAFRRQTQGVRPIGGAGTSPGGPVYELPVPVDYTTNNAIAEVGYSTKAAHLSIATTFSSFRDHNDFVAWRNPIVATGPNLERSTLATDNDLVRVGVNGTLRGLPMSSTLAARATWSRLTSRFGVAPTYLSVSGTTGNNRLSGSSEPDFDGEVVNRSLSLSLNSQWARGLDSRVYSNWYERTNHSTELVFRPSGPGSGGGCDFSATGASLPTCTPEHLDYEKRNVGVELGWRIDRGNKVSAAVDYLDTERKRFDFDRNRETRYTLEWKTAALDWADARVKYQRLTRKSRFLLANDPNLFNVYVYRFDAAPLDRDLLKLALDTSPRPNLDLGFEVILKRNDYRDTFLGRTKDTRRELYLSATYGDPASWRVTAFFDVEHTQYDSTHWTGSLATFPNPNAAGTTYLWNAKVKDRNYLAGLAGEYPVREGLKLKASAIVQKTDGTVDFATPNNFGNPMAIGQYDSFRKRSIDLKATYAAARNLDLTLGVAHENYDYRDIQMDGYLYTVRTGTTQNLLTGAYAFPSYNANTVYATLTLRFP